MATVTRAGIRRNVVLNLAGFGMPLAAALVAVPMLLHGLGPERFGVVGLALALVTVVGVFDLGFGRAMTRAVAARIGRGEERRIGSLVGTATIITATLGVLLAGGLYVVAPVIVFRVLEVPAWLQGEAVEALQVLALAVPAVLVANCLRGVLEAHQHFGALNALRAGIGTALLLGPVIAVQLSPTLIPVMWVFVAVRWFAVVGFAAVARRGVPGSWRFESGELLPLARIGGWMTVSTVTASMMIYADRFVIGGLLSMAAVAYYVAPFEIVTRLSVVPTAIMGVLFPAYSQLLAAGNSDIGAFYRRTLGAISLILGAPVLVIVFFSRPLLELWLGPEVAGHSAAVASILAVAALAHGLLQPSFHLLQAAGRPDVPALFQLCEAPIYVGYLVFLTLEFGIVGAAAAWLVRVTISLVVQSWLAHRFVLSRAAVPEAAA
jgi:O-antigen/teichoic acid export membrane protein